jgi:hypothetical protein
VPGLAQTYFLLEKEILTPKYQIKYAPPAIPTLLNEQQQRAAKVWFANVDVRVSFGWAKNTEGKLYEIRMRQEVYFQRLVTILAVIGAMALIILVLVGLYRGARAANVSPCGCLVCVGLVIVIVMIFLPVYSKKGRDVYVTISERMVMEGAPATSTAPASPSPTAEATTPAEPERKAAGLGEVRLRQFFPETLFSDPAVITDAQGRADLTVPLADSITSWRLSALASSKQGELGSATHGLRVFQDFFVDLDLPVALTQGDEVSISVAVYNYLKKPQTVRLVLAEGDGRGRKGTEGDEGRGTRDEGSESGTPRPASRVPRPADTLGTLGTLGTSDGGWFALLDSPEKTVTLEPNEVNVVYFRLKATGLGPRPLTVFAYGSEMSDAIRRWIDVRPNGKEVVQTFNGRLSGEVTQAVEIPQRAIDGASKIFVKVYPGTFSQLVEGLDALLSAPHG